MPNEEKLSEAITTFRNAARGLVDLKDQAFIIAFNDGQSSTVAATGTAENLMPIIRLLASEPSLAPLVASAIPETFEPLPVRSPLMRLTAAANGREL